MDLCEFTGLTIYFIAEAAVTAIVLLLWVGGPIFNAAPLLVLRIVKLESFMTPGSMAGGFLSTFCGFGVSGPDVPLLFPGAWALA